METFLIRALQLIMSLSLLVIIHEGGHFLFARLFKVRVTKFYLFFNPWFSLFKFKPKNSETEYGIGWVPLGGYVQIAGMVDETQSSEDLNHPVEEWEFRAKPAWQRLLIMVGGVLMNFLLALFIYSMILYTWGDSYVALKDMTHGMEFNERAEKIGFCDGDILLSADGEPLERFDMDMLRIITEAQVVKVNRQGEYVDIFIPEVSLLDIAKDDPAFIAPLIPNVVDSVVAGMPLAEAGIREGDRLVAVNNKKINSWNSFLHEMSNIRYTAEAENKKYADLSLVYSRDGICDTISLKTDSLYQVGVVKKGILDYKETQLEYGFLESFPAGIALGLNTLKGYVNDMKYVFTKEGAQSLGGFGTIGSIFPEAWNWYLFWKMTAFLSIILAFMNILPIPALDGGHVLFLLYEIIARRKPSEKFMEHAQMVGMILLFALLIWANFNDLLRLL